MTEPSAAAEELVSIVDEDGAVIGSAPRSVMRRDNLRHLVVAVLVRNPAGRIYVHRRADIKDVFPGLHDCFVAGCVAAGESPDVAALRELGEELGVTGVPLEPLGTVRYDDAATRQVTFCYTTTYDGPVTHQVEEISWGTWMTPAELAARLADPDWPFVPDGRALVQQLLADGRLV